MLMWLHCCQLIDVCSLIRPRFCNCRSHRIRERLVFLNELFLHVCFIDRFIAIFVANMSATVECVSDCICGSALFSVYRLAEMQSLMTYPHSYKSCNLHPHSFVLMFILFTYMFSCFVKRCSRPTTDCEVAYTDELDDTRLKNSLTFRCDDRFGEDVGQSDAGAAPGASMGASSDPRRPME